MDKRSAAVVLGVAFGASKQEIRQAYRALAKRTHPDALGSDRAFVTLRAAFDELYPSAPAEISRQNDPSVPRRGWPSELTTPTAVTPTVDLTDVRPSRPLASTPRTTAGAASAWATDGHPTPTWAAATGTFAAWARTTTVPPTHAARRPQPRRDARGWTFDDHLNATLDRAAIVTSR